MRKVICFTAAVSLSVLLVLMVSCSSAPTVVRTNSTAIDLSKAWVGQHVAAIPVGSTEGTVSPALWVSVIDKFEKQYEVTVTSWCTTNCVVGDNQAEARVLLVTFRRGSLK